MSGARSLTGCHTCRLRKKKCDEAHPVCMNCTSRNIPCYGYGAKPPWMNGGSAEAEQVGRIKRMAEMNYRARRRGVRVPGVVGGMDWEAGQPLMMAGSEEAVKQNWDLGAGAGQQEVMVWEAGGEGDLEGKFVGDFSMSSAVGGRRLSLRKKGAVRDEMGGKGMGLSSVKSGSQVCRPPTSSFGSPGCASQAPFSAFSASQAAASRRLQSPRTLNSIWWHSGFADSYHVRNNQELGLLMHYLDNVFCLQFGFICLKRSQPVLDRGRGWYLNTLLRCQPLYFATLSISAYHQHLMKAGNLAASWAPSGGKPSGEVAKVALNWDAEKNLLMTLNGLQEVIDNFQGQGLKGLELLKEWWQVLGTMCQVLSLEVFRTLGGNWPIHIQAARTFLSMIGSSSFPSSTSLSRCASSKSPKYARNAPERPERLDILEQILKDDKHQFLSPNDAAALKHFVTSFTWVDILSRASGLHPPATHKHPASQTFDYLPLLEDRTLDLSCVMGCENWVFTGLVRIVLLEHALAARRDQLTEAPHDPNALDPYSQAAVLEAMFESGIRGLVEARTGVQTEMELHSSLVTELFALAAITYLHVTVSGAYPWFPKVRVSVTRTLAALVALPEGLLIRVSWPFAVTGCMVLEEKQDVVREVVFRAARAGINTGTIWKGMVVIEECWRLRGGKVNAEVSWVTAMKSLGEKILLC